MHRPAPRLAALAGFVMFLWAVPPPAAAQAQAGPPAPGTGTPAAPLPESADSLRTPWRSDVPDWPVRPRPAVPLLLDTSDFGFGTSVMFDRMPDLRDLHDVGMIAAVQHVVVSLPEWPAGYEALQPLGQTQLPEGADLIVILPGYPPSRAAAEAWNYLRIPLRIVMVVDGPPASRGEIDELNRIRGLERVIADMPDPSRSGFERLQRPLSFRVVMR